MKLTVGGRLIGKGEPPFIIAEIGINHCGNLDIAKSMAKQAITAGADCIKHQTHFVEDEMTSEAKSILPPNAPDSIWDVIASCALSKDDEIELKRYTESLGGIYISTPFSRQAADFLVDIGVTAFKIGSGECTNIPLVRHIASFGKPIIMSTGMSSIESIGASVDILRDSGAGFALLECTNLYPSPPENVSLCGIKELESAYPDAVVGFSDHSIGPYMAIASVAVGACIIERHFTDSRYRSGPDIACSMDPSELSLLKTISREIFVASTNKKSRTTAEEAVFRFARASVVADRDIPKGTTLSADDIWARRPGTGEIPASEYDKVVGRTLLVDVSKNQQLSWADLA